MSGLWTPGGDPAPEGGGPEGGPPPQEPTPEEVEALRELHARLISTPVADVIANHALGMWQLALVHLGLVTPPDPNGNPPPVDLASAGFAIDALAALVETLGSRFGEYEGPLREALGQIQVLYVQAADQQE